jgi:hypothetical protein
MKIEYTDSQGVDHSIEDAKSIAAFVDLPRGTVEAPRQELGFKLDHEGLSIEYCEDSARQADKWKTFQDIAIELISKTILKQGIPPEMFPYNKEP